VAKVHSSLLLHFFVLALCQQFLEGTIGVLDFLLHIPHHRALTLMVIQRHVVAAKGKLQRHNPTAH